MPAASPGNVIFSKLVAFAEATPGTVPTLTSGGRKLLVSPTGVLSAGTTLDLGPERSVALRNPLLSNTATLVSVEPTISASVPAVSIGELPIWLSMTKTVTPGTASPYAWDYNYSMTTANNPKTYSLVATDGQQQYVVDYCLAESITIAADRSGLTNLSANLFGQTIEKNSATLADGTDRVLQWADRVLNTLANDERFDVKEFERRALPMGEFTVSDTEDGQKTFSGYAALFDTPSAGLPFTEVIAPGAFKRTLSRAAAGSKVIAFLFGHDESRALATTASGRLSLQEDERGLRVEAKLDPADPDAAGVISKLTHEAAAMGMSFGFSTPKGGDAWEGDKRTIREVNLFEVSVLSAGQTPAYPATLGLTAVRKLSADKIGVEAERLMTTLEAIKAAQPLSDDDLEVIDQVRSKLAPRKGIDPSVAAAKLVLERLANDTL